MNWRPHTQQPDTGKIFAALIAVRDADLVCAPSEESFYLLDGLYNWRNGQFESENTGIPITEGREFWWFPESELLESLREKHDLSV
jgi:hypothetical protein